MKSKPLVLLLGLFLFLAQNISNNTVFAAAASDSTVFSQGNYSIERRLDAANEWIYTLSDKETGSSCAIYQRGANCKSFIVALHGIQYSLIYNQYGMFRMMPWPNRTKGGKFTDSRGISQDLFTKDASGASMAENDGAGNAIHGMVRNRLWSVEEAGADSEGVFIRCYFDTDGFPVISGIFGAFRDFSVYRLKGNRLMVDSYVRNKGARAFDNCGWGFHPFFNAPALPLSGTQKGSKARCSLLLPALKIALVDNTKIPTGALQSVSSFNNGAFDFTKLKSINNVNMDTYFTDLSPEAGAGYTRTVLIDFGNRVRLQCLGSYPGYPWMVIYNPNGSSYICIEHQTEEVNGLNTKQNQISIPPDSVCTARRIQLIADDDTTTAPPTTAVSGPRKTNGSMPDNPPAQILILGKKVAFKAAPFDRPLDCVLYTVQGKRAAVLESGTSNGTVSWNLRNGAGTRVSSGVYIVKLRTGRTAVAQALLL